jgi:hypothetical protein
MTARTVAAVLGVITIVMGLAGLASPQQVMAFVEFAPLTPSQPVAAWCEARAVYGGLFTVLGAFTLWGAVDPAGNRSALLMSGFLWLGLCAGRSLGIAVDGSPGFMGWVGVAWEAVFGSALVWSAISGAGSPE